jgi:hypothetical protein
MRGRAIRGSRFRHAVCAFSICLAFGDALSFMLWIGFLVVGCPLLVFKGQVQISFSPDLR